MKSFSKLLSILLCLSMLIGIFAMTGTAAAGDTATLVTDVSSLQAGDKVILVGKHGTKYYAAGTNTDGNNRRGVEITVSGTTATLSADTQIFTVGTGTVSGSISLSNGSQYLYTSSSSKNYLKYTNTLNGNASFKGQDGTLVAQGDVTRNYMYCNRNQGTPIFSCYAKKTESDYCPVSLYKLVPTTAPTIVLNKTTLIMDDMENREVTLTAKFADVFKI